MEDVNRRMQAHLQRLRSRHADDQQALRAALARQQQGLANVRRLEQEAREAESKYCFFQELRCYLEDLLECLDVKAPLIEDLEDDIVLARKERGEALKKRRQTDLQDQLLAARDVVGKATGNGWTCKGEAQVDEFGRDPAMARDRRIQLRRQRRERTVARRRAEAAAVGGGGWREVAAVGSAAAAAEQLEDEMVTTDESDGEVVDWARKRNQAMKQADELMVDVVSDFRSLAAVFGRVQTWQSKYPKAYKDAYVALSLPRLLAPYVRLQALRWEPIDSDAPVDSMPWVAAIFADPSHGNGHGPASQEDEDLIPRLVEQVLVPRVKAALASAWDPCSARSTARAAAALQDVMVYVLDAAPEAAKSLCAAAASALAAELARHAPPLALLSLGDAPPPPSRGGRSGLGPAAALGRRSFLQCCKLFRSAAALRSVVSPAALQAVALDRAMKEMLLPFLQTLQASSPAQAAFLSGALLDSIPAEWRGSPLLGPYLGFHRAAAVAATRAA